MSDLILASTSPYRAQALQRLGLHFRQEAPRCDEDALKQQGHAADEMACFLAQEKARSVAQAFPQAVVIGSDQLALHRGQILGKPGSTAAAQTQLQALSGSAHHLLTAMHICSPQGEHRHLDRTVLHMRALSPEAIARYVSLDQPLNCAGAYKIEAAGIGLFTRIESEDHSAITGLPLLALMSHLIALGIPFPSE